MKCNSKKKKKGFAGYGLAEIMDSATVGDVEVYKIKRSAYQISRNS